jgi:hypothetical protein
MGQMVNDEVFEKIVENDERAFVWTNSCTPENILTWEDVEHYINDNLHNSEIVIIGDNQQKQETYISTHTNSTPTKSIVEQINNGSSFILNSMERYTKGLFYASNIFSLIHNKYVTTNVYGGIDSKSKSFRTHADSQYVLILQLDGISDWTIFGEVWNGNPNEVICTDDSILTVDFQHTLLPGDVLYIPYRRYHKCIPKSKRLSASVSADFSSVRPNSYGDWCNFN